MSINTPYPLQEALWEIPRGRGILKDKIFNVKYEQKVEFPWGWW